MKYKVGDKVRIRKDLVDDKLYGTCSFNPDMREYVGRVATIAEVCFGYKCYILTECEWWHWTEEMLEDVDEMKETGIVIDIITDGKETRAKYGNKVGVARCHPEDEFDIFTGAKLALERLEKQCSPYPWLKDDIMYYIPDPHKDSLYGHTQYNRTIYDERMIKRGLVFKTKEEAVKAAKKMLVALKDGENDC